MPDDAPQSPPEPPSTERTPRAQRMRLLLDRTLSASAGLIAITALAVSIHQAWISRQQQKPSAWPYVTQTNTGADCSLYGDCWASDSRAPHPEPARVRACPDDRALEFRS